MPEPRPSLSSVRDDSWQQKFSAKVSALCPQTPPSPTSSLSWNCLGKSDSTEEDQQLSTFPVIPPHRTDTRKRVEMYGELCGKIGEGSNGVILIYKRDTKLYAVKRFRKPKRNENTKEYMKRLASEYCIASSVSAHPNILKTIDLVLKEDIYCTVMEYCTGGDLFACIKEGRMTTDYERACCFKQMIRGLAYLHSLGVAHCDLKPENLLWTARGQLKIADFGSACVFRTPYDNDHDTRTAAKKKVTLFSSITEKQQRRLSNPSRQQHQIGSLPYLAPEFFSKETINISSPILRPDAGDIWSAGIVLYCLYRNGLPWKQAIKSDSGYREYLRCQETRNFILFTDLPSGPQCLLYLMLDIDSQSRISAANIIATDNWCRTSMVCRDGIDFANNLHQHIKPLL